MYICFLRKRDFTKSLRKKQKTTFKFKQKTAKNEIQNGVQTRTPSEEGFKASREESGGLQDGS